VERLTESACKRAAGDKLWCGTCHDVHTGADKSQAACTNCHQAAHHAEERCATCHMPRAQVADANHAVMTDHRIPRVPQTPAANTALAGELAGFLGAADDRAKGLAYAELGDARAAELLRRAVPRDWPVRLRLAVLERDPGNAARLYESVLRDNPREPAALVNLGSLYAVAGRDAEAGQLWERALTVNPALEPAVLNLAKVRAADEARVILRRYLEVNPVSKNARARLAELEKKR
jgi:tetratricopeptide (TPR) repeat protein